MKHGACAVFCGLLVLVLPGIPRLGAVEVNFPVVMDSQLESSEPNDNHGTSTVLEVNAASAERRRVVLKVSFPPWPPEYQDIDSAKLLIYMFGSDVPDRTYDIHRINSDRTWVENEVTWNSWQVGKNWTSPGGDYRAAASASYTNNSTNSHWWEFIVTADVDSILQHGMVNNGWAIKDSREDAGTSHAAYLASREQAGYERRPHIIMWFPPTSVIVSRLAAAVNQGVRLLWTTCSDAGVAGFFVGRRTASGSFVRVNELLIPAQARISGSDYRYTDLAGHDGDWYRLEVIRVSGKTDLVGPVQARSAGLLESGPVAEVILSARPNPCRGPVTFSLPKPGAGVCIYDAAGRLVRRLDAGRTGPEAQVSWDRTDDQGRLVHPGVYFCRAGRRQVKVISF